MVRIVSIDNLSAAAYRLCRPHFDHHLRFETPARAHQLIATGQCDAALLPVASLPRLAGRIAPLGPYGLACRGPVQSVQLFSDVPLVQLLQNREPVYITAESRTSVRLLDVLCRRTYGTVPRRTDSSTGVRAHLLIGDAAYEFAQTRIRAEHDLDLSRWWYEHTGLPFVFARWVVSNAQGPQARTRLMAWLAACASRATTPDGMAELAGPGCAGANALSRQSYYQHLRPRLDNDDLAGLALFLQIMEGTPYEHTARTA